MTDQVSLIYKDSLSIVGIPVKADWQSLSVKVPDAWRKLFAQKKQILNRLEDDFIEASLECTNGQFFELVGAVVSEVDRIPEEMMAVVVPAQHYLHLRHVGDLADIAQSFGKIYQWAKQQDYEASDFKLDLGYSASGFESYHDLYVKVQTEMETSMEQWQQIWPA